MRPNKLYRYIVPYVEMGGGAVGAMIAIWSVVIAFSWIGLLVYSLVALLFLFSFVSGYLLYQEKDAGVNLSMLCQAIQIPNIATGNFLYMFFSGIEIKCLVPLKAHADRIFTFYAGGSVQFRCGSVSINDLGFTDVAGVNLFAFLCLVLLLIRKRSPYLS